MQQYVNMVPEEFNSGYLKFVYDFYKTMKANEIKIVYEGVITHQIIKAFIALSEAQMEQTGETARVQRIVFHVMVECLQNMNKHACALDNNESEKSRGIFLVSRQQEYFCITTGNIILTENIQNLKNIQETYREVRDVYEEMENYYLLRREKKNRIKNIIVAVNIISILLFTASLTLNFIYQVPVLSLYRLQFAAGFFSLSILSPVLFLLYNIFVSRSAGLKEIMNKKFNVEKKLEVSLKENNLILSEYKLETIYEYLVKYFEEYGEFSINQSELLKLKETMTGKEHINAIDAEQELLQQNKNSIEREIQEDAGTLISAGSNTFQIVDLNDQKINELLNENKRNILEIKDNIRNGSSIMARIDKEIESEQHDEIKAIDLLREQDKIATSLKRLNSYKTSFEFMIDLFREAIGRREDKLTLILSKQAAKIFNLLTGDQYAETITSDHIKRIIKNEKSEKVLNVSMLHLIMLSIKLAFSEIFDELEINLPLIIDEPFQQMDEYRINKFRQIADDVSKKRQIIIFTHNSQHKDWGVVAEL